MKAWLRQHRFALQSAVARIIRAPLGFVLNSLVIASALVLPLAGVTVLENVRPLSDQLAIAPELSVFLQADLPREKALEAGAGLRQLLAQQKLDARVEFIPREKALERLRDSSGLAEAVSTLGSNPLPDAYVVRLDGFYGMANAGMLDALAARLRALPGAEHVQVDSSWIQRLAAFLALAKLGLLILSAALAAIVMAVVFNTVRLQMMTHAEEIEVSRLVGATNAYLYRPYYYSGLLLGLGAGIISLAILFAALGPINQSVTEFAHLYGSAFRLSSPSPGAISVLLASSGLLGFMAALLCTRRYLKQS